MKPREFFEEQALAFIRDRVGTHAKSFNDLAKELEPYGYVVSSGHVLRNRINRGNKQFAFALMVLDALGVQELEIPKRLVGADKKVKYLPGKVHTTADVLKRREKARKSQG